MQAEEDNKEEQVLFQARHQVKKEFFTFSRTTKRSTIDLCSHSEAKSGDVAWGGVVYYQGDSYSWADHVRAASVTDVKPPVFIIIKQTKKHPSSDVLLS